ncbi:cytochrome b561 [Aspergillus ellipticus CBS 707.79]|uniref:Cytochrome b561 n=1 Tax=Aspergillus ellipticus CBS 707.79 TaxID=1448320 RepID=A0A319DQQ8_9EURO|nr:cytochrome b561 [Aspergillus ellipticus CBS 707.79]
MASATGIPQDLPDTILEREDAPLLQTPGNAPQRESASIYQNLFTGTASAAQVGIWMLVILVWTGILSHPVIFFSPHPLLNSAALLLQVQAALIVQPTTTPHQKRLGTTIHYSIQIVSVIAFISAFIIIEINKGDHARFTSPHGVLGLVTYIFIILQALGGVVQYFLPVQILGSVDRGKSLYKYHRHSGYTLLLLELATVVAATQTTYNLNILSIPLWGILLASVLIVLGLGARIKKHKLGL